MSLGGGVSEKVSLAKKRNRFTFLFNLVRTALACSVLRLPHRKEVRSETRQKDKTQTRNEAEAPGWNVRWQRHAGWAGKDFCLSEELSHLVIFLFLFSVTATTSQVSKSNGHPSCPPQRPADSQDESWAGVAEASRFINHEPSERLPEASSLPSSSFQESLLHSLTLTQPKPSTTSLFKNERLQFQRSTQGK